MALRTQRSGLTRWLSSHRCIPVAALLAACGDSAPTEPVAESGVYVVGVVRDPDGSPVPRMTVSWEAWPAPDSVRLGAVSDYSVSWLASSDSVGQFAAHVGYYSDTVLDSLRVGVGGEDCWGYAPLEVRERAIAVRPHTPDTVLSLDLTLDRTAPAGRLAVGAVCAAMVAPELPLQEDRFTLWIDEIGDSVRGRWDINYTESRGDDYGYFSGTRRGNALTLDLRHAEPWGTCTGYTVELPLEPGDTLGVGTFSSDGCPYQPLPLRFVEGLAVEWPGP